MTTSRRSRTRPAVAAVVAVLVAAPLLSACGDEPARPAYAPEVARQLRSDVADVRAAAEERKPNAARAALHLLTRHVAEAQAAGQLPARRARRILAAAGAVTESVAALPEPPRVREKDRRPQRPPRERSRARERDDEPGKSRGKGEGKGRGSHKHGSHKHED